MKPGMACVVWLVTQTLLWAEPPVVDYLLLKNGAVLTGRVVKDGQTYVVRSLTSGGESRYNASMVAKVCGSAREVYDILKKSSVADDTDDRCRLARFCIGHQLMKEARAEIEEALKLDRRCPEALVLQKQWVGLQNPTAKPANDVPALPTESILPMAAASLDEWPLAMNPAVFQDFRLRMQPLLQTGCGTGACHGVTEGKRAFVLKKGMLGVPPSQVMTQTNLERVLALVNQQNPDSSELLKRAQQQHGHIKTWPVSVEQQAAVRQWVNYISGKAEVAKQEPATTDSATGTKKASNDFASGNDRREAATEGPVRDTGSKLPVIPGMSGSAVQQTGGERPIEQPPSPPAGNGGSGLPPIPGVSGKGQNESGKAPPMPPRAQENRPPVMPSNQANPQDQTAMYEYAKRLGILPMLPEQKDKLPDRMQITNAGTYRIEVPPPLELSDEVREQLNRQEQAKKSDGKETSSGATFLRSGTVVNSPPR